MIQFQAEQRLLSYYLRASQTLITVSLPLRTFAPALPPFGSRLIYRKGREAHAMARKVEGLVLGKLNQQPDFEGRGRDYRIERVKVRTRRTGE